MQARGLDTEQANSYAETIITYLAMVLDKFADYSSQICSWLSTLECIRNTFARQALPMIWDYAEVNPFSESAGNWHSHLNWVVKVIAKLPAKPRGKAIQADVLKQTIAQDKIIACDPPYYDNIAYGDLSDFFYVWLRPLLKDIYPKLFTTVTVPKNEELIAVSHRHNNDKQQAKQFFLKGMTEALGKLNRQAHPAFPVVIYYAFKQSESNGWETFLEALIKNKFTISGSWPLRTEMKARASAMNNNSLASSIILVCRQRTAGKTINRREFIGQLKEEMPKALTIMTKEQVIDPVDLQQSALGPGMAIFSRYDGVLKQDGTKLTVREALKIITDQLNDFFGNDHLDNDSSFCRYWFKQYVWENGQYGEAEVLAKSYSIAVEKLEEAGIICADSGKVRLLRYHEYPDKWQPADDTRKSVWKTLHYLIKTIEERGEQAANRILQQMPEMQDKVQSLAHYLYQLCLQKNLANEAQVYNNFVSSWQEIRKAA